MSEIKLEIVETQCACSADGGQCCSDTESEVKAEGS